MPRNKLEAVAKLMKKVGAIKPDKTAGDLRPTGRPERLEGRQRDGEVKRGAS